MLERTHSGTLEIAARAIATKARAELGVAELQRVGAAGALLDLLHHDALSLMPLPAATAALQVTTSTRRRKTYFIHGPPAALHCADAARSK